MPLLRPRVFTKTPEPTVLEEVIPYDPAPPAEFRDELPVLGGSFYIEEKPMTPVVLQLSQDLYDEYSRVAAAQELTIEQVLQHRLQACRTHNAIRGLWFSDSERGLLENLLQKWPLETAKQVLDLISRAATVKFDDIQVVLSPAQKRLLSLSISNSKQGRNLQSFFESLVKKELKV